MEDKNVNIVEAFGNTNQKMVVNINKQDAISREERNLAPYHRTMDEINKMPVLERTKTVCPECKLIVDGTIYKDSDNVMIRKFCPEHGWAIEKYWEDYDMYMRMKNYNYSSMP